MADIYTYKSPMGKTTKYLKKGGKYYRIKDNGQLAKEPTTGSLILGNLKNKDSSFVKKVNAKETKRIVSNFIMPDGKANASTIKASGKDDGGKAALQASKEYKNRPAVKLREKRALDIIKKDTNNISKDKPEVKPKSRPKSITDMRTSDIKMVTLKSGEKGTIKQRLAEIQKEKITEMAKNSLAAKAKKANKGGMMKKTKMMGGGYSMKKKK
tara:strand:- start:3 stop:638 length:636 start_codon:yes stop_codon:yes gene_type:complete